MLTPLDILDVMERRKPGPIVVCDIGPEIADAICARTRTVYLSRETMLKQIMTHPDIRTAHYVHLPTMIARGLAILEADKPDRFMICYQDEDRENARYRVTLKRTSNGSEIYVTSFHRTKPRQTRTLLRRGTILRAHK